MNKPRKHLLLILLLIVGLLLSVSCRPEPGTTDPTKTDAPKTTVAVTEPPATEPFVTETVISDPGFDDGAVTYEFNTLRGKLPAGFSEEECDSDSLMLADDARSALIMMMHQSFDETGLELTVPVDPADLDPDEMDEMFRVAREGFEEGSETYRCIETRSFVFHDFPAEECVIHDSETDAPIGHMINFVDAYGFYMVTCVSWDENLDETDAIFAYMKDNMEFIEGEPTVVKPPKEPGQSATGLPDVHDFEVTAKGDFAKDLAFASIIAPRGSETLQSFYVIIANNSDKALNLNLDFKITGEDDAEDESTGYVLVVGPKSITYYEDLYFGKEKHVSCEVTAEEETLFVDASHELDSAVKGEGEDLRLEVTNKGDETVDVSALVLLLNNKGKPVFAETAYFSDEDGECKPGDTIVSDLNDMVASVAPDYETAYAVIKAYR